MDLQSLLLVASAFAVGGILKGATGAGAAVLAVPILVLLYDVQFAVAVFIVPNLVPNLWQMWSYRSERFDIRFVMSLALGGALGAGIGTVGLAKLNADLLTAGVAIVVLVYVGFRLLHPAGQLAHRIAYRIVWPVSVTAGVLQGASGVSAPVSITFLNAMNLPRGQFISTISVFFVALAVVQLPLQVVYGIMTLERFVYSLVALAPLALFMPIGSHLGKRMSRKAFDLAILSILTALSSCCSMRSRSAGID